MRRKDREVKDFEEIIDILKRSDTIHLGINGGEYPYVVPLSFAFAVDGQNITIYIHGAKQGLKHDMIVKDSRVCVEASICHGFTEIPQNKTITTEYESFIGFGRAEIIDEDEALKGLSLICERAGFKALDFDASEVLAVTRVYKITLDKFSGKRRFV